MHLALLRHGIGPGDEVITTPMTFCATTTAILETGATPVFVDVDPASGLLTAEGIEPYITDRTKAILPVHLYGRMVDMKAMAELADRKGLVIIEDAAHAVESRRDGIRPGQLGRAACFSFYATKSMTCGEGGGMICSSEADADWYKSARHHGITKNAADRYTKKYEHWDMMFLGWKYNMDDIQASLLLSQIDKLDERRRRRQDIENMYRLLLSDVDGLDLIEPCGPGEISGHHLFTVLVPRNVSRDDVLTRLQDQGIGCAVNYRAVHNLTYFRETFGYRPEDFPVADEIGRRTITLPLYPKLSENQVERVCRTLKNVLKELAV
jgi:dTDP-4-amino-4,6-dideoxygalactose transaminase